MVLVERQADVVTITLNRPDQFNALSEKLLVALADTLDQVRTDARVRCEVLAAAGKAFCAGHDLREMRSKPSLDYYRALFRKCCGVMQLIQSLDVPVIAHVHGLATAAGCQLVASCDLAFAAIRHGKRMFYRQLEMPLAEAYLFAGELMAQT